MKNIFKLFLGSILLSLFFTSCEDENFRDWSTTASSFELHDTAGDINVLYASMEDNPFILSWDKSDNESGGYSVVVSDTEDFATKTELGTSTTTSLKTTVGALNNALLQANFSPYVAKVVYIRVETAAGAVFSNSISFNVTPYPSEKPVITNPTSSSVFVLSNENPDAIAATLTWKDYENYGVDVTYLVEIAAHNSTDFKTVGTVNNAQQLDVTHQFFDQVVLKTGATAEVENDIDMRVTATSVTTAGTITKVSDIVTFKVTPYMLEDWLYVPGDHQGWDPATADGIVSATSNGIYVGYINFLTENSYFKITKDRSWDVNYGSNDGVNLVENGDNIKAAGVGYYQLTVNMNDNTFAMAPHSWGVIGSGTPGGWDNDTDFRFDYQNQVWVIDSIALTDGEIKFRLNNAWETNYGDNGADGTLESGGSNIPVTAGNYKIVVDFVNSTYQLIEL